MCIGVRKSAFCHSRLELVWGESQKALLSVYLAGFRSWHFVHTQVDMSTWCDMTTSLGHSSTHINIKIHDTQDEALLEQTPVRCGEPSQKKTWSGGVPVSRFAIKTLELRLGLSPVCASVRQTERRTAKMVSALPRFGHTVDIRF